MVEILFGWMRKLTLVQNFVLFERGYGELLEIPIEQGERMVLRTVNSQFTAYGHEVTVRVLDLEFHFMAYFPESREIRRSLLGRKGWLLQVRLAIIDYDQILYLSRYDS
jgi:hypothetical protein